MTGIIEFFKKIRHLCGTIAHASKKRWKEIFLGIGVFVLSTYLVQLLLDQSTLQVVIDSYPFFSGIILVAIKATTVFFAPLSGGIVYVMAGSVYPFREAFGLLLLGNALGMTVAFFLGRWYGARAIRWMFGKKTELEAKSLIRRLGNRKGLLVARVVLFPIEDLLSYLAGMTKIRYGSFLVVSVLITTLPMIGFLVGTDELIKLFGF